MTRNIVHIIILVLLFIPRVNAQQPVYNELTEKDGLPDFVFYSLLEDREGYIWLAANKGLYRYDGREFKLYSSKEKRGLSVFGLKLDSHGRVWCNNLSGQYFYIEDDSLKLFCDLKDVTKGQPSKFIFFDRYLVTSNFDFFAKIDMETKKISFEEKVDYFSDIFKKRTPYFMRIINRFDIVQMVRFLRITCRFP
ncbi:two-component regulator propeller domain-containing protein [Tenacibaculum sp. SG-28]|uniref:two-component regulator propeller domain-containing protein n=1 Tax=Tenacibaculum sp. SG-28 TaxID=754426 RepID=UPI000CF4784C|nr:two-component regulator propeller domain-containing protein [Tenacibaculum sp. SG-28]PQJ23011.1 hypothetical protein BSU00_01705 [Tenacibaculum sp. SG-28]